MVFLNPDIVTLGALRLTNVAFVAIDRQARRTALEYSDLGPYAAFVDVPEQRITLRIVRRITESETSALKPGDKVVFSVRVAPGASAAQALRIECQVVITSIDAALSNRAGATQRISAVAVSTDGAADPIVITSVFGEV